MIRWRFVGVALVMGATLLGCSPDVEEPVLSPWVTAPVVSATPSPTPTPSWSVKEQAAIDAVQAYLAKWTEIAHDPANADIDSIREVTTGGEAEATVQGFDSWRTRGLRLVGEPSFEPMRVDPGMIDGAGHRWEVTGCYVLTGTYVVDSDGVRVSSEDRIDRAVMMATVLQVPDGRFFVSESERKKDKSC